MRRRHFVRSFSAAAIGAGLHPKTWAATRPFVTSDIATLRKVIVNRPSTSDYFVSLVVGDFPVPWLGTPEDAVREHRELERLLEESGAKVLQLEALLDEAIGAARKKGVLRTWLNATFPRLDAREGAVTGATLLARTPDVQFQTDGQGNYRHVIEQLTGSWWVRDAAVMTPRGLVICNFLGPKRRPEARLLRFAADFAPSLAAYPVVFDGAEEGLILEGGDFQVLDERTILMGCGNRTDPRVAPVLARRLEMDVVAVQMRKADALKWTKPTDPLRGLFLHLDTCFTRVDEKKAVALPYFFEAEHSGKDPFTRLWKGIAGEPAIDEEEAKKATDYLANIGWLKRYVAGTGEEDPGVKDMKLVDWVRRQGWTVHYVGGPAPAETDLVHFFRVVMVEHEKQAANVVAASPGRILAYDGAPRTHADLRAGGVKVDTFAARELWPGNGGPHCLTLPLERG
jgi:arginine deiminase